MKKTFLTISEAAKELQLEPHVLRYWEEELDINVPRNEMSHRLYGPEEMHLLHSVKELKQQGFQLRAIKLLLHDLQNGEELDLQKLVAMRDEINRRVEFLNEEGITVEDSVSDLFRKIIIQKQLDGESLNEKVSMEKREDNPIIRHPSSADAKLFDYARPVPQYQINGAGKVRKLPVKDSNEVDKRYQSNPSNGLNKERVEQFQYIMIQIMNQALQENTEAMTQHLSQEIRQMIAEQFKGEMIQEFGNQLADQMKEKITAPIADQVSMTVEQNLGDHISDEVATRIIKEMNYESRMREEEAEERFQNLDELIRNCQIKRKRSFGSRGKRKKEKSEQKMIAAAKEQEGNKNAKTK